MIEELLNLTRVDVLTAADNHILDTAGNAVVAVLIHHTQVTGVQVSVLIDNLGCSLGVLVVTLHHVESLAAHLTLNANRNLLIGLGIQHLDVHELIVTSHGGVTHLIGIVYAGLAHTG